MSIPALEFAEGKDAVTYLDVEPCIKNLELGPVSFLPLIDHHPGCEEFSTAEILNIRIAQCPHQLHLLIIEIDLGGEMVSFPHPAMEFPPDDRGRGFWDKLDLPTDLPLDLHKFSLSTQASVGTQNIQPLASRLRAS